MQKIVLEEKNVLKYISNMLHELLNRCDDFNDDYFHHNIGYHNASSAIKHGLLSLKEQKEKNIVDIDDSLMKILSDTSSHVNGVDGISLSRVGLSDLYDDEEEYDPFISSDVDLLVDSKIKAFRSTTNYGNEYICNHNISPSMFKSLDVRYLKYIDDSIKHSDGIDYKKIVQKYNELIDMARELVNASLDIPFREMSFEPMKINTKKMANCDYVALN